MVFRVCDTERIVSNINAWAILLLFNEKQEQEREQLLRFHYTFEEMSIVLVELCKIMLSTL